MGAVASIELIEQDGAKIIIYAETVVKIVVCAQNVRDAKCRNGISFL
jgi:hypothetical protein